MAPPKFKDLHKANDDAFSKDYHSQCVNQKLSTKYSNGSIGNGTMTHKLNYSTSASKPSGEIEFKHTIGSAFGKYLDGAVATKTYNSGNGSMKFKLEKNCGNGTKWTWEENNVMGWNFPPTLAMQKPNLRVGL